MVQDAVKETLIKVYLERCKLRHYIRYLEWRFEFKLGSASDEEVIVMVVNSTLEGCILGENPGKKRQASVVRRISIFRSLTAK